MKPITKILKIRKDVLFLFILLSISLVLRLYGVNFPLFHWDEKITFGNIFYASYHNLSLPIYEHGSFLQYIILLIWFLYQSVHGLFLTTYELIKSFSLNMMPYLILARIPLVLVGTGTVFSTYALTKRAYNKSIAIFAAVFLAFNFLHVSHSHYARGHILATFFIVIAVYYSIMIYREGKQKHYILAGLSLGLSVGAQYSGVLVVSAIFVAHFLRKTKVAPKSSFFLWFLKRPFLFSLNMAVLAFFMVTPYAILDFSYYAAEMKWFLSKTLTKVLVDSEGQRILIFYITEHLKNGLGVGIEVLAFGGVIYSVVKHKVEDLILLTFPTLLFFSFAKGENFARYALPLIPFLMIFAARLLVDGSKILPSHWQSPILSGLAIILVFPSMMNIVRYDYWITQPDTRQLARTWIIENIPTGTKIVSEGAGVLSVDLPLDIDFLDERISQSEEGSYAQIYNQALLATADPRIGYRFFELFKLDQKYYNGSIETINNATFYKEHNIKYLITVSWMKRSKADAYSAEFQASLDSLYKKIAVFEPTVLFRWDPYCWRMDYEALSQIHFGDVIIGGPRLVIYQLR